MVERVGDEVVEILDDDGGEVGEADEGTGISGEEEAIPPEVLRRIRGKGGTNALRTIKNGYRGRELIDAIARRTG